mgnify:CR=1 FL=1
MGKFHQSITPVHVAFIEKQHIFFVATAPLSEVGRINLSPKGLNCFKVLSENTVAYMDLISSGNETSAHLLENGRITLMFCGFQEPPLILRLYGQGRVVLPHDSDWQALYSLFSPLPGARQIIVTEVDRVQTSCGFGVPLYDYKGERDIHFKWAATKGATGLNEYIQQNNLISLDGLPTNLGVKSTDK